ncbi:hypothetical protein AB9K35_17430 [Leisingera sp. XS_AS12]|uniref:hypothetical protein n=1 Tax=Leisingera sp. XS_AS12 TaxID=3241294 RepID=UPI0035139E86
MSFQERGRMAFPEYTGARCYMMPFIQGRGDSLPEAFASYREVVDRFALPDQEGELGLITIDESFVEAGRSQRGYGAGDRTIHTEACLSGENLSWGPTWGPSPFVRLERSTRALIANSLPDTCMVWDVDVEDTTRDGDLSARADQFPREAGRMMDAGEVIEIGIFTPHEPIRQRHSGPRQFFRIVGHGVHGREDYFTRNEYLERMGFLH